MLWHLCHSRNFVAGIDQRLDDSQIRFNTSAIKDLFYLRFQNKGVNHGPRCND